MGTQKNRLNETVLLGTQNMLRLVGKKKITILHLCCSTGPMEYVRMSNWSVDRIIHISVAQILWETFRSSEKSSSIMALKNCSEIILPSAQFQRDIWWKN